MTWKLSASAVLLIMQHMDVCSSFKPAMIAFLFFVAKSILMGTNRSQDFSQEISSLVEKQNLCLEHRRSSCLAYIDGKHCPWSGISYIQSLQMVHGPLLMSLK